MADHGEHGEHGGGDHAGEHEDHEAAVQRKKSKKLVADKKKEVQFSYRSIFLDIRPKERK